MIQPRSDGRQENLAATDDSDRPVPPRNGDNSASSRVAAMALLVIGVSLSLYFLKSYDFVGQQGLGIGTAHFPLACSMLLSVVALLMLLSTFRHPGGTIQLRFRPRTWLLITVIAVFPFAFAVDAVITMAAANLILASTSGARGRVARIVTSLVLSIGLYWVFEGLLNRGLQTYVPGLNLY